MHFVHHILVDAIQNFLLETKHDELKAGGIQQSDKKKDRILTGTAAISVGFSTVVSPLLPLLILED